MDRQKRPGQGTRNKYLFIIVNAHFDVILMPRVAMRGKWKGFANRPNAIFGVTREIKKRFVKGYPKGSRFGFLCSFNHAVDFETTETRLKKELLKMGYSNEKAKAIVKDEMKNIRNVVNDLIFLGLIEKLYPNKFRMANSARDILIELSVSGESSSLKKLFYRKFHDLFDLSGTFTVSLSDFAKAFMKTVDFGEWIKERTTKRKTEDLIAWIEFLGLGKLRGDSLILTRL